MDKWISCSERLPEIEYNVLVYLENKAILIGRYSLNDKWMVYWLEGLGVTNSKNRNVTHWQNLPDPPIHTQAETNNWDEPMDN